MMILSSWPARLRKAAVSRNRVDRRTTEVWRTGFLLVTERVVGRAER
jgi:hypothetical protein